MTDSSEITLTPRIAAMGNAIVEALNEGAIETALSHLEELRSEDVDQALVLHLVGLASLQLGEIGRAMEAFETAHKQSPEINEPVEVLAILYARLGRLTDGLFYAKLSVGTPRRFPISGLIPEWIGSFEQNFFNMTERPLLMQGDTALLRGNYEEAIRCYRQSSQIDPRSIESWRGLAEAHRRQGTPFDGLAALGRIQSITLPEARDFSELGLNLEATGRWPDALQAHDHAATQAPSDPTIGWLAIRDRLLSPAHDRADIAVVAGRWQTEMNRQPVFSTPIRIDRHTLPNRALRLGLHTSNWLNAGALELIVPLLSLWSPTQVLLHVYSDGIADTSLARRLRGHAAIWDHFTEIDDKTAAYILGNEDLDVLIDLDGPLKRHRPCLFLHRPHPIALSFLDLPETAAAAGFTGILTDGPVAGTERHQDILTVTVPGLAASLPGELALLTDPVREREPTKIFGTLAAYGDITDTALVLWAEMLKSVPGSSLSFYAPLLAGELGMKEMTARLERLGVGKNFRVIAADATRQDYLDGIDLLLDPPGCAAYETVVMAIAAGVPVLSSPGNSPPRRVVADMLVRLGLGELVATDGPRYIAAGVAALSAGAQPGLRARLRQAVGAESRAGTIKRAQMLETALRQVAALE